MHPMLVAATTVPTVTPGIAVVRALYEFRPLIGEAKVSLFEDQDATEWVEGVEDRRDCGGAGCEESLAADSASDEEARVLPMPQSPRKPRQNLVEGFIG